MSTPPPRQLRSPARGGGARRTAPWPGFLHIPSSSYVICREEATLSERRVSFRSSYFFSLCSSMYFSSLSFRSFLCSFSLFHLPLFIRSFVPILYFYPCLLVWRKFGFLPRSGRGLLVVSPLYVAAATRRRLLMRAPTRISAAPMSSSYNTFREEAISSRSGVSFCSSCCLC